MKKIGIVHYLPLEYYPPVTNLLDCIGQEKGLKVKVWSCHNVKNRQVYPSENRINISRIVFPKVSDLKLFRFLKYLIFNVHCFCGLVLFRPHKILYFESFSVGPVYWYLKLFGKKTKLLIHNHEYFDPEWYKNGMAIVNHYHQFEKTYLFEKADWISQTNTDRVQLFVKDHGTQLLKKMKVVPNFPPEKWKLIATAKTQTEDGPIKTVFVGSLSKKTTYLEPYCNWVVQQNGKISFDVFSYNIDVETASYLKSLASVYINFEDKGVSYHDIPKLLSKYDVGLILYKDYTSNFKYNATNKLFEYLTCNLQVWYAEELLGVKTYQSAQVIPVDFKNLSTFECDDVLNYEPIKNSLSFSAEEALKPLIKQLIT